MMKNKNKVISLSIFTISSIFLAGCATNESNTNLKPAKIEKPLKVFHKKEIKEDLNKLVKEDSLQSGEHIKISKKEKTFHLLAKEKVVNYLAFKKTLEKTLSYEKVTFDFKDVDIQEVFNLIASTSDMNIILGEEVKGKLTAKLVNVPWNVALDNILKIKGLVKSVNGNIIRIHKPQKLVQLENYDKQRMASFKEMNVLQKSIEPLELEVFNLFYLKPIEVQKIISEIFMKQQKSVSGIPADPIRINITTDERTRSIIVEAPRETLNKIGKVIKNLDIPTEQVLIESFIVEGGTNFKKELGIKLGISLDKSSSQIKTGSTNDMENYPGVGTVNILKNISSGQLEASLRALQSDGFSKTLANPKFYTMNNEEALMKQGSQIPYVTSTADSVSTLFKDAVLQLKATPNVIGDGNIMLDILVTKDRPEKLDVVSEPGISKMEIKTKLLIKENEVVMIGGVYEETESESIEKVPVLGDIPILGYLFQNTYKDKNKKELLIFITAKVLK